MQTQEAEARGRGSKGPHNDARLLLIYRGGDSLVFQSRAYQLLMTYSAVYAKLLVSERLSGPSHHRLRPARNHCTTAPFCLCQYIRKKILQ